MPGEERDPDEIPGMFGVGTPMRRPRYIPLQQAYTATGGLRVHRSRECSALAEIPPDSCMNLSLKLQTATAEHRPSLEEKSPTSHL